MVVCKYINVTLSVTLSWGPSWGLSLYSYPANRFTSTSFIDSICMCYYMIFVFSLSDLFHSVWPYDPVIPLLGIIPEKKTIIPKDTCTSMFTAALFTIARTQKQPKSSSKDEWIKNMWNIYTVEYYSAIKRKKTGSFIVMWMNLESVQRQQRDYILTVNRGALRKYFTIKCNQ